MDSLGNRHVLKILLNESRGLCLAQGWERRPRVDGKISAVRQKKYFCSYLAGLSVVTQIYQYKGGLTASFFYYSVSFYRTAMVANSG
jgi:hypothetical protein